MTQRTPALIKSMTKLTELLCDAMLVGIDDALNEEMKATIVYLTGQLDALQQYLGDH